MLNERIGYVLLLLVMCVAQSWGTSRNGGVSCFSFPARLLGTKIRFVALQGTNLIENLIETLHTCRVYISC